EQEGRNDAECRRGDDQEQETAEPPLVRREESADASQVRAAHSRVGRPLGRRIGGVKEHAHHRSGYVARWGQRMRQPGWRTTENLAETKSPFRPTSSRRSSIRRGSNGAPPPSVTGAIETITSSSSPASAN